MLRILILDTISELIKFLGRFDEALIVIYNEVIWQIIMTSQHECGCIFFFAVCIRLKSLNFSLMKKKRKNEEELERR